MKKILVMVIMMTLVACAPKASDSVPSNSGGGNDGFDSAPIPHDPSLLEKVDINGFTESSNDLTGRNGKASIAFDKEKLELILFLPMPGSLMFSIPPSSLPNYPDIIVASEFDGEGNLRLKIRVPIKYVLMGIKLKDGARLPSGEKLPPTPAGSGELPALALEFPHQKLYLYVGVNSLGAYITLPEDIAHPLIPNITAKIKNKEKEIIGYLTYVSPKMGFNPGLFLGTRVPPKFATFLEDYLGL